jgi:hypothetical protein
MNLIKAALFTVIALSAATLAYAQDPHVFSEYKEQLKATLVYTDKMYLLSTAEQVIDVEFNFRLKQKQSRKQPERVDLMLWSHARELKYEKDKDREIILRADGDAVKVEKVIYMPFKKLKKYFERIKDAFAEWIIVYLNPEECRKLATAKVIKLHLGKQELSFSDNYTNTVRDFASRIPSQ